MQQEIYIKSWLGYKPQNPRGDSTAFADSYDAFYEHISNAVLPSSWLNAKKSIANEILPLVSPYKNILSIGCGIGIIETHLIDSLPLSSKIIGVDPFISSPQEQSTERLVIKKENCLNISDNFDIAYMNTVDYALSDDEYIRLATHVNSISSNGIILSELMIPSLSYIMSLKYKLVIALKKLPMSPYRFWGVHRTIDKHLLLLQMSGYSSFALGFHSSGSLWIHASTTQH